MTNGEMVSTVLFASSLIKTLRREGRKAGRERILEFNPEFTESEANLLIDKLFIEEMLK